ncbi:hypothetical protein KVR01_007570 [Diaporthe batatas]|uniref:uncharacterized protein n=1 Tax=Diaporthe batatas TaxID=748121 RepID=UPI001D04673F|nr:uncharacterized protein KVR01_007570 [Diaporthe batatas]KAG8163092.1 hypothetical protein KVR01_007570 [Diaporthe batatas]
MLKKGFETGFKHVKITIKGHLEELRSSNDNDAPTTGSSSGSGIPPSKAKTARVTGSAFRSRNEVNRNTSPTSRVGSVSQKGAWAVLLLPPCQPTPATLLSAGSFAASSSGAADTQRSGLTSRKRAAPSTSGGDARAQKRVQTSGGGPLQQQQRRQQRQQQQQHPQES